MNSRTTGFVAALTTLAATGAGLGAAAAAAPAPAAGNGTSYTPAISRDGRFVAFASDATNLVAGDTNGKRDIFIRDTVAKTTRRVSVGTGAKQANGSSFWPKISDNGRYISFISSASNLVAGDTNRQADAFRVDTSSGAVTRLSVGAGGRQANGKTANLDMDATGTKFVFSSTAGNLVSGDTNSTEDVFVRDVAAGTTKRISTYGGRQPVRGQVEKTTISPNGAFAGFTYKGGSANGSYEWTRSTNSVDMIYPDYLLEIGPATNYGVSTWYSVYSEGSHCTYEDVDVPQAGGSLAIEMGACSNYYAWAYDVNPAGTMVAMQLEYPDNTLYLFDADTSFYDDDPEDVAIAALPEFTTSFTLASDGQSVVYADDSGQIRKWTHKTGAIALISTR